MLAISAGALGSISTIQLEQKDSCGSPNDTQGGLLLELRKVELNCMPPSKETGFTVSRTASYGRSADAAPLTVEIGVRTSESC
jgi:hypothetical protein